MEKEILLKPVVASHVKVGYGHRYVRGEPDGDLIYNFNDCGENLLITIVEDELMGPAVPRTEAENLSPHILQTLAIIRVCLR